MNDETESAQPESAETEPQGPKCGERLAEARRARQISVLEVAKELHIDEAKVRALEQNDFEILGAPVFAKGHLKKYSQLVGINHDDVLADYYRLTRSQEMPPVVLHRPRPHKEISPGPWIAAIVVILIAALAYWLLVERPFEAMPGLARPVTPAPAAARSPGPAAAGPRVTAGDEAVVEEAVGDEAVQPAGGEASPAAAETASQPVPASDASPLAPPAADQLRLSVTFQADCWTEITDASGQRLFFGLGQGGRTVNVNGTAPVSVLFGDADSVQLRVNGEDVSLANAERRGRTARLTLGGT